VGAVLTILAAVLLIISAFTHAGWNLIGKRQNPSPVTMFLANTIGSIWLVPVLFFYGRGLAFFSPLVWLFICLTGLCQAGYFFALSGAYRSGDLSVAYPLARSAPVILVAVISLILGHSGQISPQSLVGMLLVTAGGFFLPMIHFKDLRLKNYLNLTCLLAMLTACCTAGYSLIDDQALRTLRQIPGMPLSTTSISILYALIEAWSCSSFLLIFILVSKEERQRLMQLDKLALRQSVLMGTFIIMAYTLVLVAMNFVSNVSYVVAFRQISIVIGGLAGMMVLKEPRHPPKFAGLAIMFIGLVLVGTG
jgi:drug/metabolite transporter (DMT)-like permease